MDEQAVARARRAGKRRAGSIWAKSKARRGEHVHVVGTSASVCYNGSSNCDEFVRERLHWNGEAFVEVVGA